MFLVNTHGSTVHLSSNLMRGGRSVRTCGSPRWSSRKTKMKVHQCRSIRYILMSIVIVNVKCKIRYTFISIVTCSIVKCCAHVFDNSSYSCKFSSTSDSRTISTTFTISDDGLLTCLSPVSEHLGIRHYFQHRLLPCFRDYSKFNEFFGPTWFTSRNTSADCRWQPLWILLRGDEQWCRNPEVIHSLSFDFNLADFRQECCCSLLPFSYSWTL
jgi:hypothetical protein